MFERANADNILKFLHGIPRSIRLDQARCQTGDQVKAFCNQNNIQFIEAPIHDHRAIGLFEMLIQTIRNRLACIKTAARKQYNSNASTNSIIYQLRICRQKTINISPFEAHFGRKANTPLSNISNKPDSSGLIYKPILSKYLDMETVRWEELISEDHWDTEERSDIELEAKKDRQSKDAVHRSNADPNNEPRVTPHPDFDLAVPRTKASLTVKLANKKPKSKRSKKILDGLYEILAPGSSVINTDAYTSIIKEPGKHEVTIRNSDLAQFGSKAERQTDKQICANRRPKYTIRKDHR